MWPVKLNIIKFKYSLIGVGAATVCLATVTCADDSLGIPQETLQKCAPVNKPDSSTKIHRLMAQRRYQAALENLPRADKLVTDEQRYLFGKLHYLLAYDRVERRLAEQPDPELLEKAHQYITRSAKAGYPAAIYDQAVLLTPREQADTREKLLRAAAGRKYVPAMLTLARDLFLTSQDYERRVEAQSLVQRASDMDTSAKIELARYYLHEDTQLNNVTGYAPDFEKAVDLLREAASDCDANAAYFIYELAAFKHKPNTLKQEVALSWLHIAAQLGLPLAQGKLAEHYQKVSPNMEQAMSWGKRASAAGDATGMMVLGNLYYTGLGTTKDLERALDYFEQALDADSNNHYVQDQLGMMYYKGEGGEVNFRRAAELCKLAANQGQAGCQYYLGLMYVNGEGVTQDIDLGIDWMKRSAAQDFAIARNWLRENW